MQEREYIAILEVVFESADGHRSNGTISVGIPYKQEDGLWRCPVAVKGLHNSLSDMAGVNPFASLSSALTLIHRRLRSFTDRGGKVIIARSYYDNEGERPLNFEQFFSLDADPVTQRADQS